VIEGLKYLNCRGCPLLTSIPVIEGLKTLYCSHCPSLTSIPFIEGLEMLDCRNCRKLQYISYVPYFSIFPGHLKKIYGEIFAASDKVRKIYSFTSLRYKINKLIQYSLYLEKVMYSNPRQAYMKWLIESGSYDKDEDEFKIGVINSKGKLIWLTM
jgi:hypothetical protein